MQAQWWTLGEAKGGASPPIIFTEALVFKSGSARKFLFQEVEPLLIILVQYFALLLSWLQQFVRLCVTLCNLVT